MEYHLEHLNHDPVDCFFYKEKLSRVGQTVLEDDIEIDEILDKRGTGRNKEVLVRWLGYGNQFNEWIKANKLREI